MGELFGGILKALGYSLAFIYKAVPSYGIAIVLLTVLVRVVLIPLTIKQIRSMTAMQRIQPEMKRLQQKYKGDRQKLNEELMKLYKQHNVNPLGGCLPLLMQAPVFIALYSVLRASVPVYAVPVEKVILEAPGKAATTEQIANLKAVLDDKDTICRPNTVPSAEGAAPATIVCSASGDRTLRVDIRSFAHPKTGAILAASERPSWITLCQRDTKQEDVVFACRSQLGTGHLPRDGAGRDLFEDIVEDRTGFLGMHLACSPSQANSKSTIRTCAPEGTAAGGAPLVAYYSLVALMIGTTYYQQRQMSAQATGPQAAQMKMMTRIMPAFLGFVSLNIPSGVIVYWIVSNLWTIGQQSILLKKRESEGQAPAPPDAKPEKKGPTPKPGPGKGGGKRS